MTRARFERLVADAVKLIPRHFRREMKNLALVVEEAPSPELLDEMEIEPPDSLYGLYQGTPLPERTWAFGNALPDRITLFQRPIEEDCQDDDEIRAVIGETLTPDAAEYGEEFRRKGQPLSDRDILRHYGGDATLVWASGELTQRTRVLTWWYLVTLLALASAVVTVCQAGFCATRRTR